MQTIGKSPEIIEALEKFRSNDNLAKWMNSVLPKGDGSESKLMTIYIIQLSTALSCFVYSHCLSQDLLFFRGFFWEGAPKKGRKGKKGRK